MRREVEGVSNECTNGFEPLCLDFKRRKIVSVQSDKRICLTPGPVLKITAKKIIKIHNTKKIGMTVLR